jgi:ring-1,2-phenylacetyl-CoA epoxidase subunit PaaD
VTSRTSQKADSPVAGDVRAAVAAVVDPELPMLTIADLGILRGVTVGDNGHVDVTITPTYSGCPALEAIRRDIVETCARHGRPDVTVHTALAPAWTTDWITEQGKRRLREHGISPPARRPAGPVVIALSVRCPQCGSPDTHEVSRFGSTPCQALWVCDRCLEPFPRVKTI